MQTTTQTAKRLHVYYNEMEYVIAESPRDASLVLQEMGASFENHDEWKVVDGAKALKVFDERGKNPIKKTADEWALEQGRGFLACED